MASPPTIQARTRADLPDARSAAGRAGFVRLSERRGAREIAASQLAYLVGSPEGRRFLGSSLPRAIARGEPAAFCPATGLAMGPAAGSTGADAAASALDACLDDLATTAPGADCGCRVIALDNVLTVPRQETIYATGITARLVSPALGLNLVLVAEETDAGVILRDLNGVVAELDDGAAPRLTIRDAPAVFEGTRHPVGFRRGRLAARYALDDAEGRHVTLLIGFDPGELAAAGGFRGG